MILPQHYSTTLSMSPSVLPFSKPLVSTEYAIYMLPYSLVDLTSQSAQPTPTKMSSITTKVALRLLWHQGNEGGKSQDGGGMGSGGLLVSFSVLCHKSMSDPSFPQIQA